MKQIFLSLFIIFLNPFYSFCQDKFSISGTIRSEKTGETLINAYVNTSDEKTTTTSNEYGFYSLTLPKGIYQIQYSFVGHETITETITLDKNIVKNISLPETIPNLENIHISTVAGGRNITGTQMGVERLSMSEIKNIPMLFGERDILKAIQLLPGIKPAGDGNSGFYVRGGSSDQNLILLDEAPVYNASHLMGFFSTFNSDVIKDVTVFKGGMPAQYGGRLSSVLDVKMNDGNNQNTTVSGGLGLISAKATIEGPIQRRKSSFLLSGRRTYADLFVGLAKDTAIRKNKLYFYDYNGKMNFTINERNKIHISGYYGRDFLKLDKQFQLDWGNITGTLRWNHIFNSKLFSNTSFIYSNFDYNIHIRNSNNNVNISSQIKDINLKQEFQWYADSRHSLRFGINSIYHNITPGEVTSSGKSSFNNLFLQKRYSWDNALFATDTWKATDWLNLSYGVRVSSFSILGPGEFYTIDAFHNITDTLQYKKGQFVKTYWNLEPRLAASFIINNSSSVKASYVRNTQALHLIANSAANTPTDKWIASTNSIRPEISDQVSLGWYKNFDGNKYELTTETYYKTMLNQIDYKPGADVFTNDAIESQILTGRGRAYGWELMLKKSFGALTGWINYTLAKTERKINGINNNNWYNARQDRTHDINIVANYQFNKRLSFSANWVFYTGDAVSFPGGKYVINNQIVYYYTERNAYRMPPYHRLDLGAVWQLKPRKNWTSELAFGIFNVYGRENPYMISFRQNEQNPSKTEAVQTSLFRFVPSVSYNFKFR